MTLHDARPERAGCAACQDQGLDARAVLIRAALALLLKLALLAALYFLFFSPSHRPALTGHSVAERILGRPSETGAPP